MIEFVCERCGECPRGYLLKAIHVIDDGTGYDENGNPSKVYVEDILLCYDCARDSTGR